MRHLKMELKEKEMGNAKKESWKMEIKREKENRKRRKIKKEGKEEKSEN